LLVSLHDFIRLDIDGVLTVAEQLKESVDNCSSKLKLVQDVENVEEPKNGMTFNSIEELHAYYRSYAKQEGFGVVQKKKKTDENGCTHYITLGCARQGNRQPSSSNIFTDQDRAMKSAINKVFPNTRHRFCLWHILKKLPEKFGSHSQYTAIKNAIRSCVYDSQTCEEFDASWQTLLDCYNLEDNAWLRGLYSERTFWVPAYLKGVFWAGMTTTQRSESMNAFFDGYVHSSTSLKEFVDQYDNALRSKVEKENLADFSSFNVMISCVSEFPFEMQFQKLYTHDKYKEVQKEIRDVLYCSNSFLKSEGGISTYQVIERVRINGAYTKKLCFTVYYNEPSCELNCSCCWFESIGILCRHAISVLTTLDDVTLLPEKYFLNRWRKDLKRPYKLIKSSYDPLSSNPSADRFADLSKDMLALATIIAPNLDHYMEVKTNIAMLTKKFSGQSCEQSPPSQSLPSASITSNLPIDCMAVEVRSPHVARIKGKRATKRKMSEVEKAVKNSKGNNKQSDTNPRQQSKKKQVSIKLCLLLMCT
jgi:hypothetical protein